jgi:two-component SAPR family response regulator
MILNCIIVDDDKTSQTALSALVSKNPKLNLLEIANNGKKALELTKKYDLDLVFLDVSMPVMNGFQFLDQLVRRKNLKVILVTSEKEHALKAFDYNITDYLLKPVSQDRFNQAIDWILQTI